MYQVRETVVLVDLGVKGMRPGRCGTFQKKWLVEKLDIWQQTSWRLLVTRFNVVRFRIIEPAAHDPCRDREEKVENVFRKGLGRIFDVDPGEKVIVDGDGVDAWETRWSDEVNMRSGRSWEERYTVGRTGGVMKEKEGELKWYGIEMIDGKEQSKKTDIKRRGKWRGVWFIVFHNKGL